MSKKNVKKNYIFTVIYQLLLIVIPIIVTPYISRVLGLEGVGEYSFSYSLITYFTIFAALGFGIYAQREIAKHRDNPQQQSVVFWEITLCRLIPVGLSLILNLVLIFCGVYGKYTYLMILFCINIVAIAFDIAFFFQGNEEFGKIVLVNLIIKISGTIGIFVFVKTANDIWIYALLNSLVLIVSNLSMWCFLGKRLTKVKLSELRPLRHLRGTCRLFIPTLATSLYTVLDKSLIGIITHADAENGFYEQAEKIVKISMTVITCLGTVMIPRNTYEINHGNLEKAKENNYKAIHFVWLLGMPLTCGIILVARNLVPWFLGSSFDKSALLIQVMASLVLIVGLSNVMGLQYLLPNKKDKQYVLSISVGAFVNLALNIPLIYYLGSFGAALATIIAEFSITVFMLCLAAKELAMGRIFKMAIKPLLASMIMSAVVCPLSIYLAPSILNTFIIGGCGVVVYGLFILIFRDSMVFDLLKGIKNKLVAKTNHD